VIRWIPGIKWEINFCLHHLSGIRNYPDYKIREFQERLEQLRGEYKRWVRKAIELDPDTPGVPGDPHSYVSKKKMAEIKQRKHAAHQLNPNGYSKLYSTSTEDASLGELELDFGEADYYEDFEEFVKQNGLSGPEVDQLQKTMQSKRKRKEENEIITPLAVRPEGYVSEEENEEPPQPEFNPHDPQNQPLAFAPKKQKVELDPKLKSSALGGLLGYTSDDE